jgi:hypothetical protein
MVHWLGRLADKPARKRLIFLIWVIIVPLNLYWIYRNDQSHRVWGAIFATMALWTIICLVAIYASGAMQNERKS